jgi:ribosomal protein S18 acetylase RimI-like enzyme
VVREATKADVPRLTRTLARAFYDDPPTKWVSPDDSRRLERLTRAFALGIDKIWLPGGESYTTDGVTGGALWQRPGKWKVGLATQLRLLPGGVRAYGRDLPRFLRLVGILESKHPEDPHYFLAVLGVDPDSQGRGLGTALMTPVLERCDRERISAYLESTTPRSRTCYERVGFRVTEEITLPDGPPVWLMWREPR